MTPLDTATVSQRSSKRKRSFTSWERALVYGLAGWAIDSLYVWLHTGRRRPSSLLNVPVYGLAQPLFEPAHDRMRHRSLVLRALVYGVGVLGVEYASGRVLRRFGGSAPWDYGRGRWVRGDGLVRLDYLPLWGAFGLGLERLHDALRGAEPPRGLAGSGDAWHGGVPAGTGRLAGVSGRACLLDDSG